jgi:hypothetical protein
MVARGVKRVEAAARILARLERSRLKDAAKELGLPVAGSKPELVERIAPLFDRVVTELASPSSSFPLDLWNDIVELSGGERRKSWEDVQEELRQCLEVEARRAEMERIGSHTVNEIPQSERLLTAFGAIFGVSKDRFRSQLEPYHGKNLIESVWDELESDLGGQDYFPASEVVAGLPASMPVSQPVAAPLTKAIAPPATGHWLGGRWRIVKELLPSAERHGPTGGRARQ